MLQSKLMNIQIDTSKTGEVVVVLKDESETVDQINPPNNYGSQVLLSTVEKILKKNNRKFQDLEAIEVNTGPGSFTGLRVGVSVANALGFTLNIPVNGKKIETEINY